MTLLISQKKTDFDDKLKNLNKEFTSNKAKHVLVKNESNKLKEISRKEFSKDSIYKYNILNGSKYFYSGI